MKNSTSGHLEESHALWLRAFSPESKDWKFSEEELQKINEFVVYCIGFTMGSK